MTGRWRLVLFGILGAGVAVRCAIGFATLGSEYDQASVAFIRDALQSNVFEVYAFRDEFDSPRWPYPPAFFPWIPISSELEGLTGAPFHGWIALPTILADSALAWLVQDFLGRRGRGPRTRLVAASLIAFGPIFVLISGYHNHFDSLAILPAVLALSIWDRRTDDDDGRAVWAGALIGLGCALKTAPILMLLALLPTARRHAERIKLVAAAVAVPAVLIAPFLLSAPAATLESLDYRGFPGVGGLSLVVQPNLASVLSGGGPGFGRLSEILIANSTLVNVGALAIVGAILIRCHTRPVLAAAIVWLTFYVFGTAFFFQYLVWGLPFFLMTGWLAGSAAIQVTTLVPALMFYAAPLSGSFPPRVYAAVMIAVWAALALTLVLLLRREWTSSVAEGRARGWSPDRLPFVSRSREPGKVGTGRVARRALVGIAAALAALVGIPLAALILGADGRSVITGATGGFAGDQLQYMAWIRDGADGVLISNLFSLEPSRDIFFHPMFALSSLLVDLGGSIQFSLLIWVPIAAAVLLAGCTMYANRLVDGAAAKVAAIVLALFFAAPFAAVMDAGGFDGGGYEDLAQATGEMLSATQLWGYMPTAISIGLMPMFLLCLERAAAARRDGRDRSALAATALAAVAGCLAAWLHPWQGEALVLIVLGLMAWGGDFRRRDLVTPALAAFAPLVYYFALSRFDSAWELAQGANETLPPRGWAVLLAIAPLVVLAALAWPGSDRSIQERALRLWPCASLAVLLVLSPSVPAHALGGLSLPLAILGMRGWRRLVVPRWAAPLALATVTVPGIIWSASGLNELVDAEAQPHRLAAGELHALEFLREEPRPGGVLTTPYLGLAVPAFTGRPVWNGHPSWTPDYVDRTARAADLFEGTLDPAQAEIVVSESGARFLLSDCRQDVDLSAALGSRLARVRTFGCAKVYELGGS